MYRQRPVIETSASISTPTACQSRYSPAHPIQAVAYHQTVGVTASNIVTMIEQQEAFILHSLDMMAPQEIESEKSTYRIYPVLTAEQAQAVEASGILLTPHGENQFSGFLGAGAYGKVYVGEDLQQPGQYYAIKVLTTNLVEGEHEADIQRYLTEKVVPDPIPT